MKTNMQKIGSMVVIILFVVMFIMLIIPSVVGLKTHGWQGGGQIVFPQVKWEYRNTPADSIYCCIEFADILVTRSDQYDDGRIYETWEYYFHVRDWDGILNPYILVSHWKWEQGSRKNWIFPTDSP